MEEKVTLQTRAVHAADRKRRAGAIPVTTPIYTAASYIYEDIAELDRVFGREIEGESYQRYSNPTNRALEELLTDLESGAGALATASGMSGMQTAIQVALADRNRSILAAQALYGATINMLMNIFEPMGTAVKFVDFCDLDAVGGAIERHQPGVLLMETVSNPILRVAQMDKIFEMARAAKAAVIVDNTFTTPMMFRPLEWGANLVVHSLTKYLAGHGDVLGGAVIADADHLEALRAFGRLAGPVLGPFESYLTMRGIKTFPLRMERQCANACRVAQWLAGRPEVERVFYLADPSHPDATAIARLFTPGLSGGVVSFEIAGADRERVFRFLNALRLVVPATSLGDVHSMVLYPVMASHRDLSPKQRERMGIGENLVRLSVGIEAVEDILADLAQALYGLTTGGGNSRAVTLS
jgi:cystathionine beta-lyase/cystathionine gamma-synthase